MVTLLLAKVQETGKWKNRNGHNHSAESEIECTSYRKDEGHNFERAEEIGQ